MGSSTPYTILDHRYSVGPEKFQGLVTQEGFLTFITPIFDRIGCKITVHSIPTFFGYNPTLQLFYLILIQIIKKLISSVE